MRALGVLAAFRRAAEPSKAKEEAFSRAGAPLRQIPATGQVWVKGNPTNPSVVLTITRVDTIQQIVEGFNGRVKPGEGGGLTKDRYELKAFTRHGEEAERWTHQERWSAIIGRVAAIDLTMVESQRGIPKQLQIAFNSYPDELHRIIREYGYPVGIVAICYRKRHWSIVTTDLERYPATFIRKENLSASLSIWIAKALRSGSTSFYNSRGPRRGSGQVVHFPGRDSELPGISKKESDEDTIEAASFRSFSSSLSSSSSSEDDDPLTFPSLWTHILSGDSGVTRYGRSERRLSQVPATKCADSLPINTKISRSSGKESSQRSCQSTRGGHDSVLQSSALEILMNPVPSSKAKSFPGTAHNALPRASESVHSLEPEPPKLHYTHRTGVLKPQDDKELETASLILHGREQRNFQKSRPNNLHVHVRISEPDNVPDTLEQLKMHLKEHAPSWKFM